MMKKFNIKSSLVFLLLIIFLSGCGDKTAEGSRVATLPYYSEATFTPHWLSLDSDSLKDFHEISPFSLVNQEGARVTEKDFEDKIYIVDFFFTTCPGICPRMTKNMRGIQKKFLDNDDVLLLSHSVTPNRDTVSVLKAYAEDKGVVSGKWHLVTGDRDEIYKLGRQDYFVEEDLGIDKTKDEFLHTENFVLVDKNKHIRGIYNGLNKSSVKQLVLDVETLLIED